MNDTRIPIVGHEVSFTVVDSVGNWIGGLYIIPATLIYESQGSWRGHLVEAAISVRHDKATFDPHDYFTIGFFVDLRVQLMAFQNHTPGSFASGTVEPSFDLELSWCTIGQDVALRCYFPSRSGYPRHLSPDPLSFRNFILEKRVFEFWIAPDRLSEPIDQLNRLLAEFDNFAPPH